MATRIRRSRVFAALVALCLTSWVTSAAPAAAGDDFVRLTDLRPGAAHGVPSLSALVWNGELYFVGYVANFDSRIYRYDGVNPPVEAAAAGAMADEIVLWQDAIYFRGGPFSDRELWVWNGVDPAVEALDLLASGGSNPEHLNPYGDLLCMAANTDLSVEPLCWDGTNAPAIYDLAPGAAAGSLPEAFGEVEGTLYFSAFDADHGREGWVFNGSGAPTFFGDLRPGMPSSSPRDWVAAGLDLWFVASDEDGQSRLWRKQPLQAPELDPHGYDVEGELGAYGDALFVPGTDGVGSTPFVFRQDDQFSTRLSPSVALAGGFTPLAGALYFVAGATDKDLYRWCGDESVELVSTPFAAPGDTLRDQNLVAYDGKLYMSASAEGAGGELWQLTPREAIFCSGFLTGDSSEWSLVSP